MSSAPVMKVRFATAAAVAFLAFCVAAAPARADDQALYQTSVGSVVGVLAVSPDSAEFGTGVAVFANGGVLTARHVVAKATMIEVFLAARDRNGAVISDDAYYASHCKKCRIVAVDPDHDLALLRLLEPERVDVIELAAISASPGDHVIAIGSGSGSLFRYLSGNVRRVHGGGFTAINGAQVKGGIIETSVPTRQGDSGGPFLNSRCEIVGLNVAFNDEMSFGIDVSEIRRFLTEARRAELRELLKKQRQGRTQVGGAMP